DWQQAVEKQFLIMDLGKEHASRFSPGKEHDAAWDLYEATCHDLLAYLKPLFGDARAFGFFLHADIRQKLIEAGLPAETAGTTDHWTIHTGDTVCIARRAQSLYETSYKEMIDGIAHKKAFHHARPLHEFNF